MKKLLYLALCLGAAAMLGSCQKKVSATPGMVAKQYAEHIMNDNYDAFVNAIVFTEPVKPEVRKAVNAMHAKSLRTVHHPHVMERGGIKEVKIVSEQTAPDNRSCDVVLTNHYNNGVVETVNYHMVNDNKVWRVKETPYKEIWTGTTNEGDKEVVKIRSGRNREFIKDNDNGEKHFVKDIVKRNGQIEVIKVLENGERHREVIKVMDEGDRHIDKLKVDAEKLVGKEIDKSTKEVLKAKEVVAGEAARAKEVINK